MASETSRKQKFDAAVKVMHNLPADGPYQLSEDMMLRFHSYYKQATKGPCTNPKPSFWGAERIAKWEAWTSLKDMSREEAMMAYVEEMKLILETLPVTDEVEELLQALECFYQVEGEDEQVGGDTGFCSTPNSELHINSDKEEESKCDEEEGDNSDDDDDDDARENAELTVSSMSNGTHSSLNSQDSEEELVCLSRLWDTRGEEICGVMDLKQQREGRVQHWQQLCGEHLDGQICTALLRLQEDMRLVLHRLSVLESQIRLDARQTAEGQPPQVWKDSWRWPFSASPGAVILAVMCPVAIHCVLQFCLHRRSRKISGNR